MEIMRPGQFCPGLLFRDITLGHSSLPTADHGHAARSTIWQIDLSDAILAMSVSGQKWKSRTTILMSVKRPKAEVSDEAHHFRFVP